MTNSPSLIYKTFVIHQFNHLVGLGLLCYRGKGEGRDSSSWEPHLRAMGRRLPYGITCHPTSERASPNPSHAGW